ncbi:Uncharacterised protein [Mycobacteroides abscessus subsp. abscessus]|nr:Uncharacterised protein [Mycobacteroides abscessus subsp. abscessus]
MSPPVSHNAPGTARTAIPPTAVRASRAPTRRENTRCRPIAALHRHIEAAAHRKLLRLRQFRGPLVRPQWRAAGRCPAPGYRSCGHRCAAWWADPPARRRCAAPHRRVRRCPRRGRFDAPECRPGSTAPTHCAPSRATPRSARPSRARTPAVNPDATCPVRASTRFDAAHLRLPGRPPTPPSAQYRRKRT